MAEILRDFAGAERTFNLRTGDILDIEQRRKIGIGALYFRLCTQDWALGDVQDVLIFGLVGGGLRLPEAEELVRARVSVFGLLPMHGLAIDVLLALMEGVEPDALAPQSDPEKPMDAGAIFANFAQMGIKPDDVRDMRYDDFVLMARAMSGNTVQPPTEEEFNDMVARFTQPQESGDDAID